MFTGLEDASEVEMPTNSMKMNESLKRFGMDTDRLDAITDESYLVQDLGIWGDDYDDFHEILCDVYDVQFKLPAVYSPSEFSWLKQPLLWLPFLPQKKILKCKPLKLSELERLIEAQRSAVSIR